MAAHLLVNIDVPDLGQATEFYTRAFELEVARDLSKHGAMELRGASMNVFLLEKKPSTKASAASEDVRDYRRHWTPVHLDFVVDDVQSAVKRARAAGAVIEADVEAHAWGSIALCSDPFGNGFCILQMSELGYDAFL